MDLKHLECVVIASSINDHRKLVSQVNEDWSQPLGFSLKMRRPPKDNKDGSKTLRLYCSMARCSVSAADVNLIEEKTGLKEEICFFALSFRFVPQSETWIMNETYNTDLLWHTHPFFHSYSTSATAKKIENNQIIVNQYFRNYKSTIAKLACMDTVLCQKAIGKIEVHRPIKAASLSQERRIKVASKSKAPPGEVNYHINRLFNQRRLADLGKNTDDELDGDGDIDIKALKRKSMIEFNLFFTRLCDLRTSFAEQQQEENLKILFEESPTSSNLRNLYY